MGRESQKPIFFRESMKQNWNSRGARTQTNKPSLKGMGGGNMGIFWNHAMENDLILNKDLRVVKFYFFVKKHHLLTTVYGN